MSRGAFSIDQALRQAFQAAIHSDARLDDEYRRAKNARRTPFWLNVLYGVLFVQAIPLSIAIPIVAVEAEVGFGDAVLSVLTFVTTTAILGVAGYLLGALRRSASVSVLSHLPASDRHILRKVTREVIWFTIAVVLWVTGLMYGRIASWQPGNIVGWVLALLIAVLQALVCVSVGLILSRFVSRKLLLAAMVSLIAAGSVFLTAGAPSANTVGLVISVLFPSGWVNSMVLPVVQQQNLVAWWAMVAAVTTIAAGWFAWLSLQRSYVILEFEVSSESGVSAVLQGPLARESTPSIEADATNRKDVHTIENIERWIRSRQFLEPVERPRSAWVERLIEFWLSSREVTVLEFLTANRMQWTNGFWGMVQMGICYMLAAHFLPGLLPRIEKMGVYLGLFALTFGVWMGPWMGFRSGSSGGCHIPHFAVWPISFDELSRTMLKVGLIRGLISLPLLICLGAVSMDANNLNLPTISIILGAALTVFLVSLGQLIAEQIGMVARFPTAGWRSIGWYLLWPASKLGVWAAIIVFALGVKMMNPLGYVIAAGGVLLLLLSAAGNWLQLRFMHNRGLLDYARISRSYLEDYLEKQFPQRENSLDRKSIWAIFKNAKKR